MANMMKMVQQANQMRKQMKKMQKEMAKHVVEVSSNNGKVTVAARGDMTIKSITVAAGAIEELSQERVEKLIVQTVNSALNAAKKAASTQMSNMQGMGGLSDMLSGAGG
jgi:DNA-binding YbaB/EbfC family protein